MALPTVYHWIRAAGTYSSPHVVPLSNFGDGPAPVGSFEGVSRDGIRDSPVTCASGLGTRTAARFILGGGWADQEYALNDAVTAPAFDRAPMNGIRLVQYSLPKMYTQVQTPSLAGHFLEVAPHADIAAIICVAQVLESAFDLHPNPAGAIQIGTLVTAIVYGGRGLLCWVRRRDDRPGRRGHRGVRGLVHSATTPRS